MPLHSSSAVEVALMQLIESWLVLDDRAYGRIPPGNFAKVRYLMPGMGERCASVNNANQ